MQAALMLRGSVRASDPERERAVAALRRHYAAGRLETHELEQRVASAYRARWRGELRSLLIDMPLELPSIDRSRVAERADRFQRSLLHLHVAFWVVVNTFMLAVWAWSGGQAAWPLVPLVVALVLLMWHARGSRAISRRLGVSRERGLLPRRHAAL